MKETRRGPRGPATMTPGPGTRGTATLGGVDTQPWDGTIMTTGMTGATTSGGATNTTGAMAITGGGMTTMTETSTGGDGGAMTATTTRICSMRLSLMPL